MHLQLASKHQPNLIERYQIFVSVEMSKRLRDADGGLDLHSYVEFKRNCRCGGWPGGGWPGSWLGGWMPAGQ